MTKYIKDAHMCKILITGGIIDGHHLNDKVITPSNLIRNGKHNLNFEFKNHAELYGHSLVTFKDRVILLGGTLSS